MSFSHQTSAVEHDDSSSVGGGMETLLCVSVSHQTGAVEHDDSNVSAEPALGCKRGGYQNVHASLLNAHLTLHITLSVLLPPPLPTFFYS